MPIPNRAAADRADIPPADAARTRWRRSSLNARAIFPPTNQRQQKGITERSEKESSRRFRFHQTRSSPSGLLRIDVHGTQARHFLLPGLKVFLDRYPDIRLHISETHQPVDIVREGYDCIVRAGHLADSPLIGRKLAELKRGTFASPEYLARFGTPHVPEDLFDGHQMVGLLSSDTPSVAPFAFVVAGKARELTLPTVVTVTGPETNVASACAGLGLIQVPRYRVASELASGALVEVLTDFPPSPLPVHVLYSHTRQLSPRLRVFIDWITERYRLRES
ncbi:LysR substrate-binding domain-containing protein [Sinorhizobium meliloti]|uniref:LysR substrate-binding domain-containing protein n=1 Tax=Rhizobium meliloti TaxID=382 RepID=UPI001F228188|nr:LysR substrate-binding domain-containing protein [Sinorhizobium meliloti]